MGGSVHPIQTVELLFELQRTEYDVAIYFNNCPDHSELDPVAEAQTNIAAVQRLMAAADRLAGNTELTQAFARQDARLSMRIVYAAMFA